MLSHPVVIQKGKSDLMSFHKCHCTFIPPYILDSLSRAGNENARLSVQPGLMSRAARSTQTLSTPATQQLTTTGNESRLVYDCQQQWTLQVSLARSEGDPVSADNAVNEAYDSTGLVRTYYKNVLNRHSIDNLGLDIISNVHYGVNYLNAFWDGSQMVFGDGDGIIFVNFASSIEVVGHELTHGVTQYTAQLVYDSQPGALSEHFSDVFGCVIEQYAKGQTAHDADWLVGDEIMGPTLYGEALRSMKAPGTAYDNSLMGRDPQPNHMSGYYTGNADNHGVHINSGVPNRAFYLVATDIGTDKAGLIWYTALQKLWPTVQFSDAAQVLAQAARDLTKAGQVPPGSAQSVRTAFRAVGVI